MKKMILAAALLCLGVNMPVLAAEGPASTPADTTKTPATNGNRSSTENSGSTTNSNNCSDCGDDQDGTYEDDDDYTD